MASVSVPATDPSPGVGSVLPLPAALPALVGEGWGAGAVSFLGAEVGAFHPAFHPAPYPAP